MKRIAILTAGGDTPALNATIFGAVARANQRRVELYGLMSGFSCLYEDQLPHVRLNPLFSPIPELDPTRGGSIIGSSRTYIERDDAAEIDRIDARLDRLKIDGLLCIGGDGTLNGLQSLCHRRPAVLAPKTIDNDLGLNFPNESVQWNRVPDASHKRGYRYQKRKSTSHHPMDFRLSEMVNYVTPGYATSVFVSAGGVQRIRTTAESHRRIAIVEVMGRHSGYIALGSSYGQPDIILLPESPLVVPHLVDRVKEIYDAQQNVVIVCGEGIVDEEGHELGASHRSTDPAGNVLLSGAADHLRQLLIESIGDSFFQSNNRHSSAEKAIFTRKVGHTQRGGRPVAFDRFYAAQLGGKAVDMLLEGHNNALATLQWDSEKGFFVDMLSSSKLRDQWGHIHARRVHESFYDSERMHITPKAADYLQNIFTNALAADDVEYIRQSLFDSGNLFRRYHSINTDIAKRIEFLDSKRR